MARYLSGRLVQAIVTLLIVVTATFVLTRLIGNPVRLLLPTTATNAEYLKLKRHLGYDRPIYDQYGSYIWNLVRGHLGNSTTYGGSALTLVLRALRVTGVLTGLALVLALVVGIPLGITAGYRPHSIVDRLSVLVATLGQAVPGFVLGIALILVFAVDLHALPASGWGGFETAILPVSTLALYAASLSIRVSRSSMRDVMGMPFIVLARAKGLSDFQVVVRHALRATMVPLVTVIGLQFAVLLAGAFVIESVFSVPGVGQLIVTAVQQRDSNLIEAAILAAAIIFVVINFVTDILYGVIDPRVRIHGTRRPARRRALA